ncbi:YbbR-like domain-containing protein [Aequorivita marina]|uniref:YbbR-like domain-containing protein n=1 Tax=Aequorivita marina TaxID=3073654 RepID=UPI0028745D17|nr:YbbR-like domain-containing protein [Aequorivita sp. S2608]MDS1299780.1 YbbR-like domain-containing protein [Aequorivita sp. S2608]
MVKGFFKNGKNVKAKRVLFFLFLATIFWILTKFSKEFTSKMKAEIQYKNIPETAALAEGNKKEITFDLTANGFEILFYKFKKPKIAVQVGKFYESEHDGFKLGKSELMRMVSSNFNRNLAINNLSIDSLYVNLDPIILKKVKVVPKTAINYKVGFKALDSLQVTPDSVTVSGPSGVLGDIHTVETELISLKNVEKSISQSVSVVTENTEIVSIKPTTVKIELKVAEFSQGEFILPVEVINLPPNIEVKLIPRTLQVTFDVSVDDFVQIMKEDFRLVCDYSKRNKEENFMMPFFEKKPKNVYNLTLEPKKVDFFIFK